MTAGKGDRYRSYNRKLWDEGWDRAFGKKENLCSCGLPLPCEGCYFEGNGICLKKAEGKIQ